MTNRIALPKAEKQYLAWAITFSHYLYDQIRAKSSFFKRSLPISSTLILAEILFKSEFGSHPLCKEKYPEKDGKWSNNLTCLELDEHWNGKFLKYEGKFYKTFKTAEEWGIHHTDIIVFHQGKADPYLYKNLPTTCYTSLIKTYNLGEFEIGSEI